MKAVRMQKPEGLEGIEGLVYGTLRIPVLRSATRWYRSAPLASPRLS